MASLKKQLEGHSLVTAEILYRMPDYLSLIQSYVWQDYDMEPEFPRLHKFLHFWETELDGPLYKVRVSASRLISDQEIAMTSEYLL